MASNYGGYTADEILRMEPIVSADSVGVSFTLPYSLINWKYTWDRLQELHDLVKGK